jgi:hypothetical protein
MSRDQKKTDLSKEDPVICCRPYDRKDRITKGMNGCLTCLYDTSVTFILGEKRTEVAYEVIVLERTYTSHAV